MRFIGLIVALAAAGACSRGPCGDPEIQCWSATPGTCPPQYFQYTGSGDCPSGYWCVDPRGPAPDDMGLECRDFSATPADFSGVD